ncbi:MAG: hypothetical protein FWH11_07545 [Micrococcales bacterium]|nr:hypothetical protein [Micrococcales bacterium]
MAYVIGDQVEDYVLTERGWVPRLELDTSPFRPGHVVNDAILTGTLEWRPLRTAPVAPYQVGDVVEGYVLVPSGDWLPLAGQVKDRSGAALRATAVPAEPTAEARRTASVRTTQTQARAQTQSAPQARTQTRPRPQPQPRPQTHQPRAQTVTPTYRPSSSPQRVSQPGAQPRIGQVVDGRVLTADRGWVPLSQVQRETGRPAPRPTTAAAKNNDMIGRALIGMVLLIFVILVRSCA